jgi:hypothetical protein
MMRERKCVAGDLTKNDACRMFNVLRVVDGPEEAVADIERRGIV